MKKVSGILGLILRILAIITLVAVSAISIGTAYIVFAPDNLPKPFYLSYKYPTLSPDATVKPVNVTPSPMPTMVMKPGEGIMINSGTKIVNLSDPAGKKYIRTTVVLEFSPVDPTYGKMTAEQRTAYITAFTAEITAKEPLIDDAIITLLATKTYDELYTADGKEKLRKEILDAVNARLSEYHVLSVYFTEFVVD
jgi:flagellar FliL protein